MSVDLGREAPYSCPWMVIYPGGNRASLDIAQVRDYQKGDWALASHKEFRFEFEARDYAIELAERHGLRCDCTSGILD